MPCSLDFLQELLTGLSSTVFEHSLGIYNFCSTCPCLIIEVLANQAAKFLKPFDYSINCVLKFCPSSVFAWFCGVMARSELEKQIPGLEDCAAFKSHIVWSNSQRVSTPSTYIIPVTVVLFNDLNCLMSRDIHTKNLNLSKYCKTFESLLNN